MATMTSSDQRPPATTRIGPFTITETLTETARIGLYRARGLQPERPAILGILPAGLDRAEIDRMAAVARDLAHPNVAQIIDSGDIDGRAYLLFPPISGLEVRAFSTTRAPEEIVRAVAQLAGAVELFHEKGVFFGAFDSKQIFLAGEGTPVLLPIPMADPPPAPPAGAPVISDRQHDVHALGSLLFLALTGSTAAEMAGQSRRISPAGIEKVLAKSTSADPAVRYAGARQLQEALDLLVLRDGARVKPSIWRRLLAFAYEGVLRPKIGIEPTADSFAGLGFNASYGNMLSSLGLGVISHPVLAAAGAFAVVGGAAIARTVINSGDLPPAAGAPPAITATPTANVPSINTPIPVGQPRFLDEMRTNSSGWPEQTSPVSARFDGRIYEIRTGAGDSDFVASPLRFALPAGGFSFEVDLTRVEGSTGETAAGYGIAFRIDGSGFYAFEVRPNGDFRLARRTTLVGANGPEWQHLAPGVLNTGNDRNRLKVTVGTQQIVGYVNDFWVTQLLDIRGDAPHGDAIGVLAGPAQTIHVHAVRVFGEN